MKLRCKIRPEKLNHGKNSHGSITLNIIEIDFCNRTENNILLNAITFC